MKVRAYLVRVANSQCALLDYLSAEEPPELEWVSSHFPADGNGAGLMLVAAADMFDFSPLASQQGTRAIPARRLDTVWSEVPTSARQAYLSLLESEAGRPVDDSDWIDVEDALCVLLRINGEPRSRRRLRARRTEDWVSAHG